MTHDRYIQSLKTLLFILLEVFLASTDALDIDFSQSRQIQTASVRISGPLLFTLDWTQPERVDELDYYLITLEFVDSFQDAVQYKYHVRNNLTSVRIDGSEFVPISSSQPLNAFREDVNYTFAINGVYSGEIWGDTTFFVPNPIQALNTPHAPENVSLTWSIPFHLVVHYVLPPDSELYNVPEVIYDIEWYAMKTVGNETSGNETAGIKSAPVLVLNESFVDDGSGQKSYAFPDLKGTLMFVRLRVAKNVTLVSPGLWSPLSNGLRVIDVPSPVLFDFASGRTGGSAYLAVKAHVPSDTGDDLSTNIPILEYEVNVSLYDNFSEALPTSYDAGALLWTAADLEEGTMYYVRARARNPVGFGNFSSASYRLLVPPSAPGLTMQYRVPLTVNFSWQAPLDLGYGPGVELSDLVAQSFFYQIYYSTTLPLALSSGVGLLNLSGGLQNNTFYVQDARKGDIVHFAVRGKNLAEQYGTWSTELNVTVIDLPGPTDTGAGFTNNENFVIRYELQFSNASWPSAVAYTTNTLLDGLEAGVALRVQVRAVNPVGAGNFSSLSDPITPLRLPSSPFIRNVTVLSDAGSSLVVAVNFSAPADDGLDGVEVSLSYFILATSEEGGCDNVTGEAAQGATGFILPAVTKGCNYTFRVRARNAAGYGSYSSPVTRLLVGLPSAPRVQQVSLLGELLENKFSWALTASWTLPEDTGGGGPDVAFIKDYLVKVSQDPSFSQLIAQEEVSNTTLHLTFDTSQLQTRLPLLLRISARNLLGLGLPAVNSTDIVRVLSVQNVSLTFFEPSVQDIQEATAGSLVGCVVEFSLPSNVNQFDTLVVKFVDFDLSRVSPVNDTLKVLEGGIISSYSGPFALSWGSLPADQVQLNLSAPVSVTAGSLFSFSLSNLTCRHWSGRTSFELRVLSSSGLVAEVFDVPGLLLLPGSLSANVSILDQRVQASAVVQLMPSLENLIPASAILNLTVSSQFVLEDYLTVQTSDLLGDFTLQAEGRSIVITRQGPEVSYGQLLSFSLLGLKSVANMTVLEPFALQTRRVEGEVIDQISPLLPSYSFRPASAGNLSCPAGTYLERLGCTNCPGNSSSPTGSTSILNCTCIPGFTGIITSLTSSCSPCPPGTSKQLPGNGTCQPCGPETYSPREGQAACPPNDDLRACDNLACKFQKVSKDAVLWNPLAWLSFGGPAPGKLIPDSELYYSLPGQNRILKFDRQSGAILLDAGCQSGRLPSDVAVPAASACFNMPTAMLKVGNSLIIADTMNFALRQLDLSSSTVSTLPVGTPGFAGTADGNRSTAQLELPIGLAASSSTGSSSTLYLLDNNRVRMVNVITGEVQTLAGSGANGFVDGVGTSAEFHSPRDIVLDGDKLYIADSGSHRIRTLSISTRDVSTLAGYAWKQGTQDGKGTFARFLSPFSLALSSAVNSLALSAPETDSSTSVNMIYIANRARVDRCYVCAPSCQDGQTFIPLCDGIDDNICE
ncbi:hypothetical protein GUITHDRAFT_103053 [Guillardia theta CCMP2712]|uniref:Fibronectin type-III domain-containing protein n=1 Tax=Guillardia theta (strain CCMP2712) TaxID=905079 RepID=L1JRQ2_GUITC|nr:hypothetical protein GUITHDRAFT_103053 [Guillardia theta CCMP2712]EKX51132.1 hypothetical protein GUITHDRAFT_103053 [Guillardia theta CCMP2712]|eukprot:XP_005838112.1 hypothetical protein GUITHDRAFT_103053 [Guillardia theta CCMP2712]